MARFDENLFWTVIKLIEGNNFPCLQNIFVKRSYFSQNTHDLGHHHVVQYQNAITAEAKKIYWPDTATLIADICQRMRDLQDFSDQTLRDEIAREVAELVESDSGRYISERSIFSESFKKYLHYFWSNKISPVILVQHQKAPSEFDCWRRLLANYNFYDSFSNPNDMDPGTTNADKALSAACYGCSGHCVKFLNIPDECNLSDDQLSQMLLFGGPAIQRDHRASVIGSCKQMN